MTAPDSNDKNLCTLSHLGPVVVWFVTGGVLGFVVPLAVMFWKKDMDPFVREHARQSSNFHLTMLLVGAVLMGFSFFTFGLGLLLAIPVFLVMIVLVLIFSIQATLASGRGEQYDYPLTIQFLR